MTFTQRSTAQVLEALADAVSLPVRTLADAPHDVRAMTVELLALPPDEVARFATPAGRYLACRFHPQPTAVLVLGPWRAPRDMQMEARTLSADDEARAESCLRAMALALGQVEDERTRRLELASQLELTSSLVLAVTAELNLTTVLHRIVDLARELVGARYAALGVPNARGEMDAFITSGLSAEVEAAIGHRPRGHGILGLLLREPKTIRLANLNDHPAAVGFPEHHPPMNSFLGVPIISRGQVLGNLYLTEKRFASEFSENDARLVELLARHAAVAIDNANLYQAIDRQQRQLQVIIDQLPEAILLVETDPERVTLANQKTFQLLGWSGTLPMPLAEFTGHNPRFAPDGTPIEMAVIESLREGSVVIRREVRVQRPDGKRITILVNSAPLFDDDGRISAAISVFQDITQIKDAEQLKDDFLSLVSHELRTPLTAIQGGALILRNDWQALPLDDRQGLLDDITNESLRLGALIENMVSLANIRAGRMLMETEPVHVRHLIEHAIAAERAVAPHRTFSVTLEDHLYGVGDSSRLEQLVRNLLHNAVKYAPGDAPIEVSGARHQNGAGAAMIAIAVRDHGPGIREDDLPLVFDRFSRSQEAISRGTPGMGLGLYLARNLVEAHDGEIWIEQPEGGGTRVVFTIPDADADDIDDDIDDADSRRASGILH